MMIPLKSQALMHYASATTVAASFLGYLPASASILAICWYLVLFYDRFVVRRDDEFDPQADEPNIPTGRRTKRRRRRK